MPEKRKYPKSCHECGVEAIDACETRGEHLPFDENLAPCRFCARNRKKPKDVNIVADFHSETWTLDAEKTPMIEDPDPHEQQLLKILHAIITGERLYGGEIYAKCK
jgi:hypothetical protein